MMSFWKWKKKQTPITGYVKRVSCGHYVPANARVVTYLEIHQTINHTESGATLGRTEIPIELCDRCAKYVK